MGAWAGVQSMPDTSSLRSKAPHGKDRDAVSADVRSRNLPPYPEPDFSDEKWPAWKVTVMVVGFCVAFWTGVAYLITSLFG